MAVSNKTMQVATCDAPTCKVTRTAAPDEQVEGFHVDLHVVGESRAMTVNVYAHSEAHIGPACRAVLRALASGEPIDNVGDGGELEGPQVPQRPVDEVDLTDDDGDGDDEAGEKMLVDDPIDAREWDIADAPATAR